MNADNFISALDAADLITRFPIKESTVTDVYQSTINVLSNGDTLIHYCDPNKPLGWEHDPATTGSQTVAAPLEGAGAPAPMPEQPAPVVAPEAAAAPLDPATPVAVPDAAEAPVSTAEPVATAATVPAPVAAEPVPVAPAV